MDILKTFGPLIGSVAPTIATALGGPVAGMAVKAISGALFGHDSATEEEIRTVLANPTGDQLAALKKIDADFAVQMKALDIDLERIAAGDRDSARDMQKETKDWIPRALAVSVTVGFLQFYFTCSSMGFPRQAMRLCSFFLAPYRRLGVESLLSILAHLLALRKKTS